MTEETSFAADLSSAMSAGETSAPVEPSTGSPAATVPDGTDEPITLSPSAPPSTPAPKPKGPIPFAAHEKALENARKKAAEEFDAQYGWAKTVDRAAIERAVQIAQQSVQNPIAYLQAYLQDLQRHPVYSAQLQALAKEALQKQQTGAEPPPDLEYDMGNGQKVPLYSATQQAKRDAWLRQQVTAQQTQALQPLLQAVQALQQDAQTQQAQAAISRYVETTYQDVLTWPGMEDKATQQAVGAALGEMRIDEHDPAQVSLALHQAYQKVVVPTLMGRQREAVALDLQQQVAAGQTVRPGHTTTKPGRSVDDMSTAEALEYYARQLARA